MGCPWGNPGISMEHLWDIHGISMGCSRGTHGVSLGAHGASMGCPWGVHGASTGCPWSIHGMSMAFPRNIHGTSVTCPWDAQGASARHPWGVHGTPQTEVVHSRVMGEVGSSCFWVQRSSELELRRGSMQRPGGSLPRPAPQQHSTRRNSRRMSLLRSV